MMWMEMKMNVAAEPKYDAENGNRLAFDGGECVVAVPVSPDDRPDDHGAGVQGIYPGDGPLSGLGIARKSGTVLVNDQPANDRQSARGTTAGGNPWTHLLQDAGGSTSREGEGRQDGRPSRDGIIGMDELLAFIASIRSGGVVDLRAVELPVPVSGRARHDVFHYVNRALKRGWERRKVIVLLDPRAPWVGDPRILGNADDRVYRVARREIIEGTEVRVLRLRGHRHRRQGDRCPPAGAIREPAAGHIGIGRPIPSRSTLGQFDVRVRHDGRSRYVPVVPEVMPHRIAEIEAIAMVVRRLAAEQPKHVLELPASAVLRGLLLDKSGGGGDRPSLCTFIWAARVMRARHRWALEGDRLVGRPRC
jgi:hypothetical protein